MQVTYFVASRYLLLTLTCVISLRKCECFYAEFNHGLVFCFCWCCIVSVGKWYRRNSVHTVHVCKDVRIKQHQRRAALSPHYRRRRHRYQRISQGGKPTPAGKYVNFDPMVQSVHLNFFNQLNCVLHSSIALNSTALYAQHQYLQFTMCILVVVGYNEGSRTGCRRER